MANWNTIIENYESNDCESLGEYAFELMNELLKYFSNFEDKKAAADDTMLCALYFLNIDQFVDGGEEDVLRHALHDWDYQMNYTLMQRNFQKYGWGRRVEGLMYDAPRRIREIFARLGCALCSGKGYVSDKERQVILKWV